MILTVFLSFCFSSLVSANQWDYYQGSQCEKSMTQLVSLYLQDYKYEILEVSQLRGSEIVHFDAENIKMCDILDLRPGGYDVVRRIEFCTEIEDKSGNKLSGRITVLTEGDLFCEDEKVISFMGFSF